MICPSFTPTLVPKTGKQMVFILFCPPWASPFIHPTRCVTIVRRSPASGCGNSETPKWPLCLLEVMFMIVMMFIMIDIMFIMFMMFMIVMIVMIGMIVMILMIYSKMMVDHDSADSRVVTGCNWPFTCCTSLSVARRFLSIRHFRNSHSLFLLPSGIRT